MRISSLLHVNVEVSDLDRSLLFYRALGLEEIQRAGTPGRSGAWFRIPDGTQIHLSTGPSKPLGRHHFAVLVDDLDAARRVVEALAAPVETERAVPGIVRFFTRDPDGNRIELQQRLP